ncbi:MAG: butyryl-CoA:acetate CoA-transferase [Mogibacterium sp.]|nr:butyryl-CoA:acetate CoA-transferase [Mogibacterium sp.]
MFDIKQVQREYKNKLISAEYAAGLVKSNFRIHFGTGTASSIYLDAALAKRLRKDTLLRGLTIQSEIAIREDFFETYKATDSVERVRFVSSHFSVQNRRMADEGNCWYVPILFNEEPFYWGLEDNYFDICCIQVAPMDKYGNFNFGPNHSDILGVIRASKTVIVEVNDRMPIALGYESHINIADVNYIIEGEGRPLPEMLSKEPDLNDRRIAEFIVQNIRNESTLQLGIGGIPNAVGKMLAESDIRDLSAHSEVFVDAFMNLYYAGKLTNNKKIDKGLSVYTFAGGSRELYEFIDDNPICCCAPVDYVNNIHNISKIDNFISINSCIGIDIYGQVCSESVGYRHVSGTGGQLDFVQGAFLSKNGKSFMCTHSTRTNKDGSKSSLIHPILPPGSIVTTPRSAVQYVVTEFGAVNLKGKSTWQRAEQLISIAHPDFREDLVREAEKMGIWRNTSKIEYV